jgi:hypothetical protein
MQNSLHELTQNVRISNCESHLLVIIGALVVTGRFVYGGNVNPGNIGACVVLCVVVVVGLCVVVVVGVGVGLKEKRHFLVLKMCFDFVIFVPVQIQVSF